MSIDFGAALPEKKKKGLILKDSFPVLNLEKAKSRFSQHIIKIDVILKEAQELKVENEEMNQKAVQIGTSAKSLIKQIEETRVQTISEPLSFVKGVNAFTKLFTDKLASIESLMKQKITQYRAFQEQKRREAELAAQKATEEVQKKLNEEARKTGTIPVQVETPIIPKQETVTRSESGAAYSRKFWTFEIININLIPRDYLIANETTIRKAINAGVREIPGINIFEQISTSFRT